MKKYIATLALAVTAAPALAHEGHATAQSAGALHWLTQADHIIVVALGLAAAALALLPRQRRALRRLVTKRN